MTPGYEGVVADAKSLQVIQFQTQMQQQAGAASA